jgi:hypothetical protein
VDVLEEEDQGLHVRDALHDLASSPGDLLWAPLAVKGFHQAGGKPEHVCDRVLGTALAELRERLLEWIVVRDPSRSFDHLGQRPIGDAFAVRQGASYESARALRAVEELACESALPDTRLAVDGEQVGATVSKAAVERILKEFELGLASDERCTRA